MTCKPGHKSKGKVKELKEYEFDPYAQVDADIAQLIEQEIDAQFDAYPALQYMRTEQYQEKPTEKYIGGAGKVVFHKGKMKNVKEK